MQTTREELKASRRATIEVAKEMDDSCREAARLKQAHGDTLSLNRVLERVAENLREQNLNMRCQLDDILKRVLANATTVADTEASHVAANDIQQDPVAITDDNGDEDERYSESNGFEDAVENQELDT